MMKKVCPVILALILLTGCTSVREFYIETYNPAEITYPDYVSRILIVNNTVAQPPEAGYGLYVLGRQQDSGKANADSAVWDACRSLGKAIVETSYFEDVLLYDYPTRTDDVFLADGRMSAEKVRELCKETGAEAIIAFDRLLFTMRKDIEAFDGVFEGKITVGIGGIARTYLSERAAPLTSVMVNDTVIFNEYAGNVELLDHYLPFPEEAFRAAGEYIGTSLLSTFVPHWKEEKRWYYTAAGSRWKEASAYASVGKWAEALESWNTLYTKSSNKKVKAKLASNMALSEEMLGHLDKAATWAATSRDLFKETEGAEAVNTKLTDIYAAVLQQRIQHDKKLDVQFGE
jgi:hypothetical protein